ncbi:MAG TPA: FecR family protein [Pyrinomonadaceae bacterium]
MKAAFRSAANSVFALTLVVLCAGFTAADAQGNRDLRVVSARAGGVNYAIGDVKLRRRGQTRWQAFGGDSTTDLDSGDSLKTGATGFAEVLLNPGSYLRLGADSEFVLTDSSLDDLSLQLVRGSAVIEATGYDRMGLLIAVDTPQSRVSIIKSGIYRFNVLASGQTEVAVRKGRVSVGEEPVSLIVKEGNVARVDRRATEVVKLDKKQRDALDAWSKGRADELAEANRKITRRQANTLLASLRFNANYGYSSGAGVWYFDTRRNCYTFVPFAAGWRSPYGGWYDNMVWGHPMPCGGCSGGRNPYVFTSGGQYGNPGATSGGGYPGGTTPGGSSGYPGGGSGVNPPPTPVVRERTPIDYGPVTRKMTREVEP